MIIKTYLFTILSLATSSVGLLGAEKFDLSKIDVSKLPAAAIASRDSNPRTVRRMGATCGRKARPDKLL